MMNRKIRNLKERLNRISEPTDERISPWLIAFARPEELAEWKAISQSCRGQERERRLTEFSRNMRRRHPEMLPLTTTHFDEVIEEAGRAYEASVRKNDHIDQLEKLSEP
jgi:hypothetical protein